MCVCVCIVSAGNYTTDDDDNTEVVQATTAVIYSTSGHSWPIDPPCISQSVSSSSSGNIINHLSHSPPPHPPHPTSSAINDSPNQTPPPIIGDGGNFTTTATAWYPFNEQYPLSHHYHHHRYQQPDYSHLPLASTIVNGPSHIEYCNVGGAQDEQDERIVSNIAITGVATANGNHDGTAAAAETSYDNDMTELYAKTESMAHSDKSLTDSSTWLPPQEASNEIRDACLIKNL